MKTEDIKGIMNAIKDRDNINVDEKEAKEGEPDLVKLTKKLASRRAKANK